MQGQSSGEKGTMEFQVIEATLGREGQSIPWAKHPVAASTTPNQVGKAAGSVLQDILQVPLWVQVCEPGHGVGMARAGDTQQDPRVASFPH